MGYLLAVIPQEAYVLFVVLVGLGLILRVLPRGRAFGIVGALILMTLAAPFVGSLFSALPAWVSLLLFGCFLFGMFRAALTFLFGHAVTAGFVGHLMWAVFTMPFRIVGFLFRGVLPPGLR